MSGTGGIDASIALQARSPAQPNPLQQIGEFANAQNALNTAKLFPGVQQLQQQAIQGGGVSLAQKINQAVYQGLTPMLAIPNGQITHQAYTDALAGLEARGLPTHGALADLLKTAPGGDGPAFDLMVRSRIASQAMVSPESSVSQITGTPADQSTGQTLLSGVRSPMYRGGGFSQGSETQMRPGPESLMTTRPVVVTRENFEQLGQPESAINTTINVPVGAFPYRGTEGGGPLSGPLPGAPAEQGGNLLLPPVGATPPPGLTNVPGRGNQIAPNFDPITGARLTYSTTPPVMPSGARPIGPGNPGARITAPAAGGPNLDVVRQNATPSSLPIGTAPNIEQNQQAYRNAQTLVAPMALNNTQFKEAHDAIAALAQHNVTTGAGQAALNQARRVLDQLGMGNSQTVVDAATAEKLLNAAIAAKAPRSDAQQSLAEHANPTLNMPAGASLPIIRQLVAGNRAQQLAVETAPDKRGNGFIAHNTEKSRTYNSPEGLAALAYDMTPGPQRDAYVANLKKMRDGGNPGPWNRFSETFKAAHESKVMAP